MNALSKLRAAARISSAGNVSNLPGRIPIQCTKTGLGQYQLTNDEGLVFGAIFAIHNGAGVPNLPRPTGLGTTTVTISTYNLSGSLTDGAFQVIAELQPD